MTPSKKRDKTQLKREKKAAKAELKERKKQSPRKPAGSSPAVRYAEFVRGCLYVLTGVSLIVALVLGQRGAFTSLDDLTDSLFAAWAGKIILGLIALALVIYGLKRLRLIR